MAPRKSVRRTSRKTTVKTLSLDAEPEEPKLDNLEVQELVRSYAESHDPESSELDTGKEHDHSSTDDKEKKKDESLTTDEKAEIPQEPQAVGGDVVVGQECDLQTTVDQSAFEESEVEEEKSGEEGEEGEEKALQFPEQPQRPRLPEAVHDPGRALQINHILAKRLMYYLQETGKLFGTSAVDKQFSDTLAGAIKQYLLQIGEL
jgi:hypothetical protein